LQTQGIWSSSTRLCSRASVLNLTREHASESCRLRQRLPAHRHRPWRRLRSQRRNSRGVAAVRRWEEVWLQGVRHRRGRPERGRRWGWAACRAEWGRRVEGICLQGRHAPVLGVVTWTHSTRTPPILRWCVACLCSRLVHHLFSCLPAVAVVRGLHARHMCRSESAWHGPWC
jgi:hypothetical protein